MDKQSITVKLNKDPNHNETKPKNIDPFQYEDEESPYTIVEWDRQDRGHSYKNKKKKKSIGKWSSRSSVKGLLITVFSALVVGGVFGFGMLKLMEGTNNSPPVAVPTTSENSENENSNEDINSTQLSLPGLSMYVIQLGVFSTVEKAEEQRDLYRTNGIESMVWPRENQFFLFAGIGSDKDVLKNFATSISEQGIETYVKEWEIPGMEKEVEGSAKNLVENSIQKMEDGISAQSTGEQTSWSQSITSELKGEGIDIENYPYVPILQNVSKKIEGDVTEFDTKQSMQVDLLSALQSYEEWGSN